MTADPLLPTAGLVAVAVGTALGTEDRPRRVGAGGLLLLGLALAAWRAGAPVGSAPASLVRLSQGFLVGNGALMLLGVLLVSLAALHRTPGRLRLPAPIVTAAGLVMLVPVIAAFVGAAGPLRAGGAALGLGLIGTSVAIGLRAVSTNAGVRRFARRVAGPPLARVVQSAPRAYLAGLGLALAAAGLAPHLGVLFLAMAAAVWTGYLGFHVQGDRPLPVAPLLTLLLLPAYLLLATVSGPIGLGIDTLPQVPMSPAAELLVTPALLLAGWVASGLWPLQRQLPGALVAPAGALLLARAALALVPEGMAYWRPLAVPLVWLGLWHAAVHRRWPLLLAGAGMLTLIGGGPPAIGGGAGLLTIGLVLELVASSPAWRSVTRAVAWAAAVPCGALALEGALRGEVVYTALGVLGIVIIAVTSGASAVGEAAPAR